MSWGYCALLPVVRCAGGVHEIKRGCFDQSTMRDGKGGKGIVCCGGGGQHNINALSCQYGSEGKVQMLAFWGYREGGWK